MEEHTEHIGHQAEHNPYATKTIDALGFADIVEEPPERVIEAPRMLPRCTSGSWADAFRMAARPVASAARARHP